MKSYFDPTQLGVLIPGMVFMFLSLLFYSRQKYKWALICLLCAGALLFSFASLLDPFLNIWDERFHALVAKNMMEHPFQPMLYREKLVDLDYTFWASAHIWLHKQPLFLWQIALSFKCFGVSEYAMRLPGIILSTALIPVFYRCGKLWMNASVGYLSALLWVSSFYLYELMSGRQMLDQNDISFVAYISLSLWAWMEYQLSGKKYWLILIGAFSGVAVLCKWFVGLLVYLIWAAYLFIRKEWAPKQWLPLLLSFAVTALLVLPWQVYIFQSFPDIAALEWEYNALHFSMPVEGHGGDGWYHLQQMALLFGQLAPFVLLPSLILIYRKTEQKQLVLSCFLGALGVHLFFFFAATKMPSFTFILALPIFIVLATALDFCVSWFRGKIKRTHLASSLIVVFLGVLVFSRMDIEKLQEIHTTWKTDNDYTRMLTENRRIFKRLANELPKNAVLFNVKGRHYVEAMFYTDNVAYNALPSEKDIQKLRSSGREIWVFQREDRPLPEYILNNSEIHLIYLQLQGYE